MAIVYEVIMHKGAAIKNSFWNTLKDAEKWYREYHALDWEGDVYRREY
jgi:hypothetical protein